MFKLDISTEEKISKTQKHKKLAITFERKSNQLFTYILKFIKSFF